MNRLLLFGCLALFTTVVTPTAQAAENALLVVQDLLFSKALELNNSEKQALSIADEWKQGRIPPSYGHEGSLVFAYGESLPSIICAPFFPCNLVLEKGEVVRQIDLGDAARWRIVPSVFGGGNNTTTSLIIKPATVNLQTALIISTDRRTYTMKLTSMEHGWMPQIAFAYPETVEAAWESYYAQQSREINATVLPSGLHVDALDFNYTLSGDSPAWTPVRVYSDGSKTYIEFPQSLGDSQGPALIKVLSTASQTVNDKLSVNYRQHSNMYVIDRVIDEATLISGKGIRRQRVEITRGIH